MGHHFIACILFIDIQTAQVYKITSKEEEDILHLCSQ